MSFAIYLAFFFTVILLVTTAYFLLGGLPLLVLKHDEPLDARFIRSFFNLYNKAAFWASLGASVSYALWGRLVIALGAATLACAAVLLRKKLVPAMQQLGADIEANAEGSNPAVQAHSQHRAVGQSWAVGARRVGHHSAVASRMSGWLRLARGLTLRSSGRAPARRVARAVLAVYHAPRGPSASPARAPQLKR